MCTLNWWLGLTPKSDVNHEAEMFIYLPFTITASQCVTRQKRGEWKGGVVVSVNGQLDTVSHLRRISLRNDPN